MTKIGFGLVLRVAYLNYSNIVSFFLFLEEALSGLKGKKFLGVMPKFGNI